MTWTVGSALAIGWFAAVPFAAAQQPPAAKAPVEPAHKVFVLSGCLEVSADAPGGFLLTDASPVGPGPAPKAEAVGTSGRKLEYALAPVSGLSETGVDLAGLKAHVGRRVEVTTRPADMAPAAAPASSSTAGVLAATPPAPELERYAVTAIKSAPGTCAPAARPQGR